MRWLVLVPAALLVAGLTGCGTTRDHLVQLEPLLGVHEFTGTTVPGGGPRTSIRGMTTQCFSPERDRLLIHYVQTDAFEDEGFAEIRWDEAGECYEMRWESTGQPGEALVSHGDFDADGRLALRGAAPAEALRPSAPGTESTRTPAEHIYTFSFPADGRFVLTIKSPAVDKFTFYEHFRLVAERKEGAPDPRAFAERFHARRREALGT
ncbi:MAG: hypothetical protein JXQ29_06450, partial [Planctomycetes bacterium]|nr:hypothetical protein [Planctomycetota bacterium]